MTVNLAFSDEKGTLTTEGQGQIAMGLSILTSVVALNNYEKGWRTPPEHDELVGEVRPGGQRNVGELTALVMTELAEAFESYRNSEPDLWFEYAIPGPNGETMKNKPTDGFSDQPSFGGVLGKPQGIASELADVIIRVVDWADEYDIPLVQAILEKHAYNQTRPWRHGHKKA